MSESIKNLLHRRATPVAFKPPDLEAITREGGRRIRRRRMAVALAAVTAVVTVVLTGALIPRLGEDVPPTVPASPWPSDAVSWASGTTIYVASGAGTEQIEVGHGVRSYVRTATGFVALDETDAVYSVTQLGVTLIGRVHDSEPDNKDQPRLVVNSRGTLVGWVDESASPTSLVLRIYTPLSGSARDFGGGQMSEDGVVFFAIDDHTAYWRRPDGIHEVDLDKGRDRTIVASGGLTVPDDIYSFEVYSAENGVLAFSPNDDGTILAGRSVTGARELHDFSNIRQTQGLSDPVRLSPTGAWLSFGVLEVEPLPGEQMRLKRAMPTVFNTTTGERITLNIPGNPPLAIPNIWLDDTTVQVASIGMGQQQREWPTSIVALYRCKLPEATCQMVSEVAKPILESGALPDGRWYGP